MTFTFNNAIPASGNNPSVDQPDMLTNNASTASIIAIDHFGFNAANGGRHKQVQLPLSGGSPGTIPTGLIANEGTVYTKTGGTDTQLFYTPDTSTNEYQLTRAITASFATLASATNGWTFLPGGMLLQYGSDTQTSGGSVTFPVAFTTFCASVQCTILKNDNNRHFIQVKTKSTTGFTVASRDSSGSDESNTFSWMAIGV